MMHSKQKLKDMKADFEEANTSVPASDHLIAWRRVCEEILEFAL